MRREVRFWGVHEPRCRDEGAPGSLVDYEILTAEDVPTEPPPGVADTPYTVAILVDRGVASAAEADVLAAHRCKRVSVCGTNTSGTIDYQALRCLRSRAEARPDFCFAFPRTPHRERFPITDS